MYLPKFLVSNQPCRPPILLMLATSLSKKNGLIFATCASRPRHASRPTIVVIHIAAVNAKYLRYCIVDLTNNATQRKQQINKGSRPLDLNDTLFSLLHIPTIHLPSNNSQLCSWCWVTNQEYFISLADLLLLHQTKFKSPRIRNTSG